MRPPEKLAEFFRESAERRYEELMRDNSVPEGHPVTPMSVEERDQIRKRHSWHTALESGHFTVGALSNDLVWHHHSGGRIEGKAAVVVALKRMTKPATIIIDHAIAHGKVGAANGIAILANGHERRFSHIFEFTSAKADCVGVVKSYAS